MMHVNTTANRRSCYCDCRGNGFVHESDDVFIVQYIIMRLSSLNRDFSFSLPPIAEVVLLNCRLQAPFRPTIETV